jgi:NADH-quinone oxidoreductase subunit F
MKKISDRIVTGQASPSDVDELLRVANNIEGKTICAFGEACSWPTQSFVKKFRDEMIGDTKPELEGAVVNPETTLAAAALH